MTRPLRVLIDEDPLRLRRQLAAALAGHGPAILPRSSEIADRAPEGERIPDRVPERVALVVETSGSTGRPKRVMLSAEALLASARANAEALGPGRWLLALPTHWIAGLQVLVRSIDAGIVPAVVAPGSFTLDALVAAVRSVPAERPLHAAFVPAQLELLVAALEAGEPDALAIAVRFGTLLVGGQAMPAGLVDRATALGLRVVRSYGSSETAGGCLYDGAPVGDARVRVVDGRLEIAGAILAEGYLADHARTEAAFVVEDDGEGGERWFRTDDLAELDESDAETTRVRIRGRADDVIVSGGVKVALGAVESVVQTLPGLATALVVGAPDARWGEVPVVVADGRLRMARPTLQDVRTSVTAALGREAAPASVLFLDTGLPILPTGKPDRAAARAAAARRSGAAATDGDSMPHSPRA